MVQRGLGAAVILAGALMVAGLSLGTGLAGTGCTGLVGQDDAGSGQDAGDRPDTALPVLIDDTTYQAAMGYPTAETSLDTEDWYKADWGDDTQLVTFSAYTRTVGYLGPVDPVPYQLAIWAPGSTPDQDPPTYQTDVGEDQSITFTTAPGTWHFQVASPVVDPGSGCSGTSATMGPTQVYDMYLGCDPHCSSTAVS